MKTYCSDHPHTRNQTHTPQVAEQNQPTLKMTKGTVITEKVCTMIAPDGTWQPMGTGMNMAEAIGIIELLANYGVSKRWTEMSKQGYKIVPATITIEITGTEEDAFNQMKK